MIHAPKEARPTSGPTLQYMYRDDEHEHSMDGFNGKAGVIHIGGNIFSRDPITYDENGDIVVDISDMDDEFEVAALNNRTAENKFKHYIISIEKQDENGKSVELNTAQWLKVATEYVEALGFDTNHKWTACIHNDSEGECQHIHILASLVSSIPGKNLISTSNDYAKGWPVMRKYEKKYGLKQLSTPGSEKDFGFNFTKNQIKGHGSRTACIQSDWGAVIRARIKNLYETDGKPKTIRDFALGLAKRNVSMQAVKNDDGSIRGINYQVLGFKKKGDVVNSPLISGSNVKGTRFTWNKIRQVEGMDYNAERDNPFIGLAPASGRLTASIKINKSQKRAIKMIGSRFKGNIRDSYLDLSFCKTHNQRNIAKMINAIMEMLSTLFNKNDIEFYEYTIYIAKEESTELDIFEDQLKITEQIKSVTQCEIWAHISDDGGIGGTELAA